MLGSVLGQPQMLHVDLTRIVVVVSVVNAVLALPALRLVDLGPAGGVHRGRAHLDRLLGHAAVTDTGPRTRPAAEAGILVGREPLPPPPVQGLAPLPARRRRTARPAAAARSSKQPRMRQSRFSVESMLDAPDTSTSRPGAPAADHRPGGGGLFALLGLRLWALTVLQAPAAAQAVQVNQIRDVPVDPTRGLILDRYGQSPGQQRGRPSRSPCPGSRPQEHPEVIGRLAALIGQTTPAGQGHHRRPPLQPVQAGARPDPTPR